MALPDAEALVHELERLIAPAIAPDTALVGIVTGGAWLAERIHADLNHSGPLGSIDVSFYRDDFKQIGLHKGVQPTRIDFEVAGRDVLLLDDVLYTGRTIRAALNGLFDYGRPARVRLAALVDRGGRELPICADFVGASATVPGDQMLALARGDDGRLSFTLEPKQPRRAA